MTVDKAAAEFRVSLGPLSWPLLEQGAATGRGCLRGAVRAAGAAFSPFSQVTGQCSGLADHSQARSCPGPLQSSVNRCVCAG